MSTIVPSALLTEIPNATPVTPLGIIGGSSFLSSEYIKSFTIVVIDTPYGKAQIRSNADQSIYFVQRHAASTEHEYSPPHLINYKAIVHALYVSNVRHVIGFGSVGSLKASLKPGTLITPDDYYYPLNPITFYDYSKYGHIVPAIDTVARQYIHNILVQNNIPYVSTGVYAQTTGPRFETPSEVRALATYADIVGMTCAHEATLTRELGINYALICMVDNYGNGIAPDNHTLSTQEFHDGVQRNLQHMEQVLGHVMTSATTKK